MFIEHLKRLKIAIWGTWNNVPPQEKREIQQLELKKEHTLNKLNEEMYEKTI